ncbi:protease FtsH-inhibitory lysogeny factor CIII [Pantoea sp. B9002]|nr:protease FtsH-inhibitory lysogeny factor CIII [Pantoea sp. B9002]NWA63021.1 protease FtsH-inhibitory lysogeny factor CIII [Pantoea sp. B9002]
MQTYAVAGATHMGDFSLNTSQLDRIVSRIRSGWRSLMDTLNQPGQP